VTDRTPLDVSSGPPERWQLPPIAAARRFPDDDRPALAYDHAVTLDGRLAGLLTRILRSLRLVEAMAFQAFPALGLATCGRALVLSEPGRAALLLTGLWLLYLHIFALNDLANVDQDLADPHKGAKTFVARGLSRRTMRLVVWGLGLLAALIFACLPGRSAAVAVGLVAASFLYSHPSLAWKAVPGASSALHVFSGAAHFLAGRTLLGPVDAGSLLLASWCGAVFAAGHLVHEVDDRDADFRASVRTHAVRYGRRTIFAGAFLAFTVSFGGLAILAAARVVATPPWLVLMPYPFLAAAFVSAWHGGLTPGDVQRVRRVYRLLFAGLVFAMAVDFWRRG
jgi:4-hydroxybenzoate polyprenyltransferase